MVRVFAIVVAAAMLSTSGSAAVQHVHAYVDHDHADHHHGPAAHVHAAGAHAHAPASHVDHSDADRAHAPEDAARLEGCDPAEHAVSVLFTFVTPQPGHAPVPVTVSSIVLPSGEPVSRHVTPSDVRAHSPPRLTDAPLRAPPVVHLA